MGRLQSTALFQEAKACFEMWDLEGNCAKDCCQKAVERLQVDDLTKTAYHLSLDTEFFLIQSLAYLELFDVVPSQGAEFTPQYYIPPLIAQDVHLQVQSLLL